MTLEMDFDAWRDYEREHPEWNIMEEISRASTANRITNLDFLTGFLRENGQRLEQDYIVFLRSGHTVNEMLDTFRDGLEQVGFISGGDPSAE